MIIILHDYQEINRPADRQQNDDGDITIIIQCTMKLEIIQCTMKWKGSCLRNWWGWGPHDDSTEYMDGVKVKVYYICCADGSGGPGGPRSPTIRLFPNLDLGNLLHTYIHIYTFIPTIYT